MSQLIFWVAVVFLVVFAADTLALFVIRRPGAARPCSQCQYRLEGPLALVFCERASHTEKAFDPVCGTDATSQVQILCSRERSGGLMNAAAIALVNCRNLPCTRYGLFFLRRTAK